MREQVRDVVRQVGIANQTTGLMWERCADAASDMWEPLLREAVAHLQAHLPGTPLVARLKEALGE